MFHISVFTNRAFIKLGFRPYTMQVYDVITYVQLTLEP